MRLIDADNAMQNVMDEIRYKDSLYTSTVYRITKKAIDAAPTIDPESLRPTAEWKKNGGWKNAKTEPPPPNTDVEVYCKALGVTVGYHRPLMDEWLTDDHRTLRNVTHWRPIPPPPPEAEP